jgi:group I intron endonuclease
MIQTNSGIYLLEWNEKYFYVGQAQNLERRKREHLARLQRGKHHNVRVQRIFNRYGKPKFHTAEEVPIEKLNEVEQIWLNICVGHKYCLNISKCAETPNRGLRHSPQTKWKISQAQKGKKSPNFGKKHSLETKIKMSESLKGERHPLFGKKHSQETVQKMSKAKKGKNHPLFGKKHSQETIRKMSKSIAQLSKNNEFIKEWNSASDASKQLKIDRSSITKCCKGKLNSTGGFKWRYFAQS